MGSLEVWGLGFWASVWCFVLRVLGLGFRGEGSRVPGAARVAILRPLLFKVYSLIKGSWVLWAVLH